MYAHQYSVEQYSSNCPPPPPSNENVEAEIRNEAINRYRQMFVPHNKPILSLVDARFEHLSLVAKHFKALADQLLPPQTPHANLSQNRQ